MICVPTSLAQEVGEALGAQAVEAKLTEVIKRGGFRQVPPGHPGPFQHRPSKHGRNRGLMSKQVPVPREGRHLL